MLNLKMFYNILIKKRLLYYLLKNKYISNTNIIKKFNLSKKLTRFFKKTKINKKKKFNKNLVYNKSKKSLTQDRNNIQINNYKLVNIDKKVIRGVNTKYCGIFFKKNIYSNLNDNKIKEVFFFSYAFWNKKNHINLNKIPQIFFI